MAHGRPTDTNFKRLLAQRGVLADYIRLARQACKKLEASKLVLANAKELEAQLTASQSKLDQLLHVLFFGNRSTRKTPLVYGLLDRPLPSRGHTYDFATVINPPYQLALVDSPGLDAPHESSQARIAPQVLLRLQSTELVVVSLATPNTSGVSSLLASYAEHRPPQLCAQDVCLIWDRSDLDASEADEAGDVAELREVVQRCGIREILVLRDHELPAAIERLGSTLDGRLAAHLTTQVLLPQAQRPTREGNDSPYIATFFMGFLSTANQKLSEYTPSAEKLDERIQQVEARIKKGGDAATDSEAQLVILQKQKETLLRYRRDLERFLAAVDRLGSEEAPSHPGEKAEGAQGKSGLSLRVYQAAAEEMFDQGWGPFCQLVRSNVGASVSDLDLLEEADRRRYVERAALSAREAGDRYLASWILGEIGSVPLKKPPPCLHATLYSLVEQSYVWAQQQWKEFQLPEYRAPHQANDLHEEIQRVLVRFIPRDTNDWNSIRAKIWLDTVVIGAGGGLSVAALAAAGAKLGIPFAALDGGAIAAIGAAAAVIVGTIRHLWAKDEQRAEIQAKLDQVVRDEFDKHLKEYKAVGRRQFSLAGVEVFKSFASRVRSSATKYMDVLKKQISQVEHEVRGHEEQLAQMQAARAQLSGLRAELRVLRQEQDELKAMIQKVDAALASMTLGQQAL